MLKFLTHKLRAHSINENPNQEKEDDDHDSGTESDDEFQDGTDDNDVKMLYSCKYGGSSKMEVNSSIPSDNDSGTSCLFNDSSLSPNTSSKECEEDDSNHLKTSTASTLPRQFYSHKSNLFDCHSKYNDQHSSEEELEVINSPKVTSLQKCRPATAPEKRKWSQVNCGSSEQQIDCNIDNQSLLQSRTTQLKTLEFDLSSIIATSSAPVSRAGRDPGSSDEEVQGLLNESNNGNINSISKPVQFRTSPPVDVHKPGRSLSPPPKLFLASARDPRPPPRPRSKSRHYPHHFYQHYYQQFGTDIDSLSACSPRKRHRPPHRQPRPCLDFEKMQQLKARALTTWRHSREHGSELSVFCW